MSESAAHTAPSATTSRRRATPGCWSRRTAARSTCSSTASSTPVGAPAVDDPGHRLHPGPDRLARAHPGRRALPADVRPVVVLHRRAAGGRGARPDDARGADRGHADLPLHADRRRGPPRRASSTASTTRSACSSRTTCRTASRRRASTSIPSSTQLFDEMLKARVDRLARTPRTSRRWSRRSRSTTWSSRACSP